MYSNRPSARAFFLVLLAAFALGGCVHVDQVLTLEEDGSGTLHLRYSVPRETLEALNLEGGDRAAFAVTEQDIRRDLARYRPFGVRLLDASVAERDGRREIDMLLGFDDLRALAATSFFTDNRLRLTRSGDHRWVLEQHLVPPEADEMDVDLRPPDSEETQRGFPEGFRAMFVIKAPATVVESNADETEGKTARWRLGEGGKPESIRFAQGVPMRLVFEGEGLALPEPTRVSVRLPAPE